MTFHILRMLIVGMEGAHLEGIQLKVEHGHAVVTAASDEDARAIAKDAGIELRRHTSGGSTWLSGTFDLDGIGVVITGPMHKQVALEVVHGR